MADLIHPVILYTILLRVQRHGEGARFTLSSVDMDASRNILAIGFPGISLAEYHVPAALLPGVETNKPLAGDWGSRGWSSAKEERENTRDTHNKRMKPLFQEAETGDKVLVKQSIETGSCWAYI